MLILLFSLFFSDLPVDSFAHSLWGDKEIPIFLYFKFKNFPIELKIDWGDGKTESLEVKWIIYEAEHKYEKSGRYVIRVKIGKDYFITTDTITIFDELFIGRIDLEDMVYGSCAIDKEDNIYIGDIKGNFYSFDLLGQKRFQFSAGGKIYGSPLIVETLIYFGADSFLYCLTKNGRLIFKNKLSGEIYNTPTFLPPDKIVISSDDGNFYIFTL
ncbi:MAG: PQQ-binding-like beta-propeller repeat protein, partial [candidate division WOR-3 bacterium]